MAKARHRAPSGARTTEPRSPGDAGYYEMASGFTHPVTGMSNHITGTPPEPSIRGNAGAVGEDLLPRDRPGARSNGILNAFFQEKE